MDLSLFCISLFLLYNNINLRKKHQFFSIHFSIVIIIIICLHWKSYISQCMCVCVCVSWALIDHHWGWFLRFFSEITFSIHLIFFFLLLPSSKKGITQIENIIFTPLCVCVCVSATFVSNIWWWYWCGYV